MPSPTQVGRWPIGCAGPHLSLLFCFALAIIQGVPAPAQAVRPESSVDELKALSLEQLLAVEVTTVSKRREKLIETASAIQVITAESIRRAGAVTLPQALRLAGNLNLAQVTPGTWNIGARGFNGTSMTSNKLLVMVDGRSAYTPLFAGTFWDALDVFLPDVARIEVVSGPGGATWGANAVNGVINVVTKSARDTQGTLVYAGGGNEERLFGGVRHGGTAGRGHYRVYAKRLDLDGLVRPSGADLTNRYRLNQAGFRADWEEDGGPTLTLQGDLYDGRIEQQGFPDARLSGGNLLARWSRPVAGDGRLQAQAYYDYAWRWSVNTFADRLETFDVDVQHEFTPGRRQRLVWGLNYRLWIDHVRNTRTQAFIPSDDRMQLGGFFLQDEFELVPDRVRLTVGSKVEYNTYSGTDVQPSARLAWLVHPRHTLWGAVSRAVRTPSRFDRDFFQPTAPPFVVAGGPQFKSEVLLAYELGWRGQVSDRLAGSLSLYQHDYDDLRSLEPGSPAFLPLRFGNGVAGRTLGVEASLDHRLADWWRWSASVTHLRQRRHLQPGSRDLNQARAETSDPAYQLQLRTALDLPGSVEVDLAIRRVGAVPLSSTAGGTVPAYTELDARAAWRPRPEIEVSVTARNLLQARHPEAGNPSSRGEVQRSINAQLSWRH